MKKYFKRIPCIASIAVMAWMGSAIAEVEPREWYGLGGLSWYSQDKTIAVGGGLGVRAGVGFQWSRKFSFELVWDITRKIHPGTYQEHLLETLNVPDVVANFKIEADANQYLSALGSMTIPTSENVSLIGKIGVARFWRFQTADIQFESGNRYMSHNDRQGYSGVLSAGIQVYVPWWTATSVEFSFTHLFKTEVNSTFLSASIKFPFPKG